MIGIEREEVWRIELVYDGKGRLRVRREYTFNSDWELTGETRYIYDGMRVIQERSSSNVPTVSYTRGTDLSGSLEGAGGLGGLLARSHGYSSGNWSTHNFYHADGNGNITYLVNSSQALAASYRYDPFGNTTASSGTLASANVYRFSSKECNDQSGFYYYGYRWYSPSQQRWLNRDPIQEKGGINLFAFVLNNPVRWVDNFGKAPMGWPVVAPPGYPPSLPPHPRPRPRRKDPRCANECWRNYEQDIDGVSLYYAACMAGGFGTCMEAPPASRHLCFLAVASACGAYSIAEHTAAAAALAGCLSGCPCVQ